MRVLAVFTNDKIHSIFTALKALKDMSLSAQRSQDDDTFIPGRDSIDVNSLMCLSAQLALEVNC